MTGSERQEAGAEADIEARLRSLEQSNAIGIETSKLERDKSHISVMLQIFGGVLILVTLILALGTYLGFGKIDSVIERQVDETVLRLLRERVDLLTERAIDNRMAVVQSDVDDRIVAIERQWQAARQQVDNLALEYASAVDSAHTLVGRTDAVAEAILRLSVREREAVSVKRVLAQLRLESPYDAVVDPHGRTDYRSVAAALTSGAKSILILPGTYADPLVVRTAGVQLHGVAGETIFRPPAASGHAGIVEADSVGLYGLSFRTEPGAGNSYDGLVLRGRGIRASGIRVLGSDDDGVVIRGQVSLEDCMVSHADNVGIRISNGSDYCFVDRIVIDSSNTSSIEVEKGAKRSLIGVYRVDGEIVSHSNTTVMLSFGTIISGSDPSF